MDVDDFLAKFETYHDGQGSDNALYDELSETAKALNFGVEIFSALWWYKFQCEYHVDSYRLPLHVQKLYKICGIVL